MILDAETRAEFASLDARLAALPGGRLRRLARRAWVRVLFWAGFARGWLGPRGGLAP